MPPTVTPSTPGSVNQPIDWHGARESAPLKTPSPSTAFVRRAMANLKYDFEYDSVQVPNSREAKAEALENAGPLFVPAGHWA